MTRSLFIICFFSMIGFQCRSGRTVEVAKPRLHKSWPVSHRWRHKFDVGRIHFGLFERRGVKKVKMKG